MFGDERANAEEIRLFLLRFQGEGSAVSETNETGDARTTYGCAIRVPIAIMVFF